MGGFLIGYKVLDENNRSWYSSSLPGQVIIQYELGKWIKAKIGHLFVCKSEFAARRLMTPGSRMYKVQYVRPKEVPKCYVSLSFLNELTKLHRILNFWSCPQDHDPDKLAYVVTLGEHNDYASALRLLEEIPCSE